MIQSNAHKFTKQQVQELLEDCLNKTLGEIDKNHVFDRTRQNPKITGIAGDVIEQSVLGYAANSDSAPDFNIDGILTELKTTGIRLSKKNQGEYEAKEPMSITAVSPNIIIGEEFPSSRFWHKLAHLLLVYYLYASDKSVLEQDWLIVRNFIRSDDWTATGMPEKFRYFCMGNALVVPLVSRMEKILDKIFSEE